MTHGNLPKSIAISKVEAIMLKLEVKVHRLASI